MKDKTIFITGGNAGIGLATALLFAKEGANVAIVGRREKENAAARKKIEDSGAKCLHFTGNVTDDAFIRASLKSTADAFGGLHYAFNNAGIEEVITPLTQQTIHEFRHIMDVNVMGVWLCMKEEIPLIQKSGGGCIVNTSSVAGLNGFPRVSVYVASKHAVIGMTKSVALEYAKENVRVNAICPAVVRTDLFRRFTGNDPEIQKAVENLLPMGRPGDPDEVASAVLYLCRDATWTTGQCITMDGGFTAQ